MPPETLAQAHREYMENQSMVTSPVEIVQAFYQIAIENVRNALGFLKSGDALARARAVTKAEEAVDELILSLDHSVGAPFTKTLDSLYRYILNQLMTGHARQSEQAFIDALTILESLADTWTQLRAKLAAEARALDQIPDTEPRAQPADEMQLSDETCPDETPRGMREARDSYSSYSSGLPAASGRDWSA